MSERVCACVCVCTRAGACAFLTLTQNRHPSPLPTPRFSVLYISFHFLSSIPAYCLLSGPSPEPPPPGSLPSVCSSTPVKPPYSSLLEGLLSLPGDGAFRALSGKKWQSDQLENGLSDWVCQGRIIFVFYDSVRPGGMQMGKYPPLSADNLKSHF